MTKAASIIGADPNLDRPVIVYHKEIEHHMTQINFPAAHLPLDLALEA